MKEENAMEIISRYTKAPYYKKVSATGVVGGATPNGGLIVHFFHESQDLPETIRINIDAKGMKEESLQGELGYTRELQVGVVLDTNTARAVGQWLIDRANEISSPPAKTE